jgi:hypothetical protein
MRWQQTSAPSLCSDIIHQSAYIPERFLQGHSLILDATTTTSTTSYQRALQGIPPIKSEGSKGSLWGAKGADGTYLRW